MDSYQCLSRPNLTVISLDKCSALLGTTIFALLADIDNDLFMVDSLGLFLPTCIMEATGVPAVLVMMALVLQFVVKGELPLVVLVVSFWVFGWIVY